MSKNRVVRLNESDVESLVKKILKEEGVNEITVNRYEDRYKRDLKRLEGERNIKNYMFFQNLKEIKKNIDLLLTLDKVKVDKVLSDGHNWAVDHIATSKDDIEEVTSFLRNLHSR